MKQKRCVGDIYSKNFVTVPLDMEIPHIAKIMARHNSAYAIVLKHNKASGIITENDILKALIKKQELKAADIMHSKPVCLPLEADFVPLYDLMKKKKIKQFPVVDKHDNVIGIVTEEDILAGVVHLLKDLDWRLVSAKINVESLYHKLEKLGILD